jgi:hypothetical protein
MQNARDELLSVVEEGVSSINKTERLLKVALNTITLTLMLTYRFQERNKLVPIPFFNN